MAESAGRNDVLTPLLSSIRVVASDVETQGVKSSSAAATGAAAAVDERSSDPRSVVLIQRLSDRRNLDLELESLRTDLRHGLPPHAYDDVHYLPTLPSLAKFLSTIPDFLISSLFHDFVHASLLSLSLLSSSLSLFSFFPDPSHTLLRASATFGSLSLMCLLSATSDCHQIHLFRRLQTAASDIFGKPPVRAVRNGRKVRVSLSELVVGDLLEVRAGDVIPADGLFVDGNMALNDLGGGTAKLFQPDHQSRPFLLSGSRVVEGLGRMIVTSVVRNGSDGFDGRVDHDSATLPAEGSGNRQVDEAHWGPLQACMSRIAVAEGKVGFLSAALVFVFLACHLFLAGNSRANGAGSHSFAAILAEFLDTVLAIPLALLVVTVPEGLPLATTLCSAYSLTHIRHKGILTRNLCALETIGLSTTICIDESVVDDSNDAYRSSSSSSSSSKEDASSTTKCADVQNRVALWSTDVERLRRNGLRVVIMSRRNLSSAKSMVSLMLREGIDLAIEANEFREWSEKERREKIGRVAVLASAEESDRAMFVKELQEAGEVVAAVVGASDGEDATHAAELLSEADIGVSAPFSGGDATYTDAAAAEQSGVDMMLLGCGSGCLWALSEAVLASRRMYPKLQKLLEFQVTGNCVLAVVMVAWAVTRGESPMKAAELLWANVLMDGVAAIAVSIAGRGNKDGYLSEEEGQMLGDLAKAKLISWRRGGDTDDQDRESGSERGFPYNKLWRRAGAGFTVQAAILISLSFASAAPWRFRDGEWSFLSSSEQRGPLIFHTFILCQVFDLFFSRTQLISFRRRILGRKRSDPQQVPERKSSHDPRLLALLWLSIFVFFAGMVLLLVVGQLPWQEWLVSVFLAAIWCLCGQRMRRRSRAKDSKKSTTKLGGGGRAAAGLVRFLDQMHHVGMKWTEDWISRWFRTNT